MSNALQQGIDAGIIDQRDGSLTDYGQFLNQVVDTPEEEAMLGLYDDGMLTAQFKPTEKGNLYADGKREVANDRAKWEKWHEYGLNEIHDKENPSPSFGSMVGDAAKMVANVPGAILRNDLLPWGKKLLPKKIQAVIEDKIEASDDQKVIFSENLGKELYSGWKFMGGLVNMGSSSLVDKIGPDEGDYLEASRRAYLAQEEIAEMEIGRASLTMAAIFHPGASIEELSYIKEGVQATDARLSPEQREQAQADAVSASLVTDPLDLVFEGVTFGAGKAVSLSAKMRLMNKSVKAAEASAHLSQAEHTLTVLRKQWDTLDRISGGALESSKRTAATRALRSIGKAITGAEGEAKVAREAIQSIAEKELTPGIMEKVGLAGRKVVATAPNIVGKTVEGVGRVMNKIPDSWAEGLSLAAGIGAGVASGSPTLGVGVAALGKAGRVIKSGDALEKLGRNLRVLGPEYAAGKSSVPYWKRVGERLEGKIPRALAKTMDMGGKLQIADVLKGSVGGSAVGYGLGALSGDPEVAKQMAAGGVVFGTMGGVSGAAVGGSRRAFEASSILDARKFRRQLPDVGQQALFQSLPLDVQRSIGTFAEVFPDTRIILTKSGDSEYSPTTGTIYINVKSRNPYRPLVAHEVAHHLAESGLIDGLTMRFLGSPEHGIAGLVRGIDGKLDPNFAEFKKAYEARIGENAKITLEDAALEYAIEGYVGELDSMQQSGRLAQKAAGRPLLSALASSFLDGVIPVDAIHSRIARHTGTLSKLNGDLVPGSGILSKGIHSYPEARKMFRNMMEKLAGRRSRNVVTIDKETGAKSAGVGVEWKDFVKDKALHEHFEGLFQKGRDGKILYRDGVPVPLSERQLKKLNAEIGATIKKVLDDLPDDRKLNLPEGHLKIDDDGNLTGRFISKDILDAAEARGVLNPSQIATLRQMSDMLENYDGSMVSFLYQPAVKTKGSKRQTKTYAPLAPKPYQTVPFGVSITKDGNVLVSILELGQVRKNVARYLKTPRGRKLYGDNPEAVMRDLEKHMENWRDGVDNADYWAAQTGSSEVGKQKRDFLNAASGYAGKVQKDFNPFLTETNIKAEGTATIRTFRLDRINSATPLSGEKYYMDLQGQKYNKLPEPQSHATRHKIGPEGFDMSKVGTGGGSQAYGYGHYFGSEEVSGRGGHFDKQFTVEGKPANIYKVHLRPKKSEFLDWDKPLSEQSPTVRKALEQRLSKYGGEESLLEMPGGSLYLRLANEIGGRKQASAALPALGIKGIRFLDSGSRGATWKVSPPSETKSGKWMAKDSSRPFGKDWHFDSEIEARKFAEEKAEGSYNHVIFDDADITILEENGKPVKGKARDEALKQMREEAGLGDGETPK